MPSGPDPLHRLDAALAVGRRRLRMRGGLRGAARGAWVGAAGAVACALARQIGWLDDTPAAVGAVALLGGSIAIGAAAGALWRTLGDRETALLLDRALHTDELLVTATWLRSRPPEPRRNAVLDELAEADLPPMAQALPLRIPQHSRWLAIPLALALVALILPAWRSAQAMRALNSEDPVALEGARLAERIAEAAKAEGIELPAGIETEIAKLARDMQGETLSADEALKRLEEMQAQLDAFEQAMAEQKSVLEDLEKAANALDKNSATQELADALRDVDMGAAGEAAQKLADKLGVQSPAQRQQTAQAMDQAGKELAQSSDPSMQKAGQAMQQAAQEMSANPDKGQQGEGQQGQGQQGEGQQGEGQSGTQGQEGGLTPEQAEQLTQALNQAREAGEQLQKDEQALERSQELNGAMEGGRQRLGGDPSVDEGESSEGEGEGQGGSEGQGEGEGSGEGEGQGEQGDGGDGQGMAANGAGQGHTWEDQGEFTDGGKEGEDGGRDKDRGNEGLVVNDFERLYKSVRDEDAEHLLTSVKGQLDENGHIDNLPIRLTSSDEKAQAEALQLPAAYREAAAEAVTSEQVPPGYREAVKQYFDEME